MSELHSQAPLLPSLETDASAERRSGLIELRISSALSKKQYRSQTSGEELPSQMDKAAVRVERKRETR